MSLVDDDRFTLPENGRPEAEAAPAQEAPVEAASAAAADAGPVTDGAPAEHSSPETGADTGAEAPAAEPEPTFGDLGLPEEIVRALAKRGVVTPFPIQAATIPDAMAGKDVLGRGRTGSGKTLSFGLPLLTRLSGGRTKAKRPRGLILTPTRELAMQVSDALEPFGSVLGLDLKVVCGGTSMARQIYALERGVDVLVATPGRLRDLIDRGAAVLDDVQVAVLDEADQMADMGFLPEVTEILDQVPAGGQRMLFSATLENEIDTLVKRYLSDPVTHEVDPSAGAVTTMTHHILVVKPKDKAPITNAIAARKGRTIIFVRTQMGADRVAEQLRDAGVKAEALHGGMTQGARTRTLADFKDGYVSVLVATDVAARGIHVDGIDLVLNVDPAGDHKDYLHRSGRTARAGRSGIVVTLCLPHQRRGVFRLMEDAGVDASRHIVGAAFDPDVARITGARSLTEVQAESAGNAAGQAEREVTRLERDLEKLRRRATELREEADRLSARAARERAELGLEDDTEGVTTAEAGAGVEGEASAMAAGSEPVVTATVPAQAETPTRDFRDDRRGGGFERRDRDDRAGRSFGGDRPARSFDRRDRDDRPARSFGDRDDRRGGFDRRDRDDRPARSYDRPYGGDRDRGARPSFGDRGGAGNRPFGRRDDHRGGGASRPFERRDDHRPARSDDRGGRGFDRQDDRKPRWKRNG